MWKVSCPFTPCSQWIPWRLIFEGSRIGSNNDSIIFPDFVKASLKSILGECSSPSWWFFPTRLKKNMIVNISSSPIWDGGKNCTKSGVKESLLLLLSQWWLSPTCSPSTRPIPTRNGKKVTVVLCCDLRFWRVCLTYMNVENGYRMICCWWFQPKKSLKPPPRYICSYPIPCLY